MTPEERNIILSGAKIPEDRNVNMYKQWGMAVMERGEEHTEKAKRRLINVAGWSEQQAEALFDVPIMKTEFINTKKAEVKELDDHTTRINAGLSVVNQQLRGLSRKSNPYGFNDAQQELESNRNALREQKEENLDQRAAIGEQLVAQANNFGKDDETAHLIRQNVAQTMNLIEGSSAYTAKPNGVYKNGQLVSPSVWNEIVANSEEYGVYFGVGVGAYATDRAISKQRGKKLTQTAESPRNAKLKDKAKRYAGKVLRFTGPLGMILGESYVAAEAGAAQRAQNRQNLADLMDVVLTEDWQKTKNSSRC